MSISDGFDRNSSGVVVNGVSDNLQSPEITGKRHRAKVASIGNRNCKTGKQGGKCAAAVNLMFTVSILLSLASCAQSF